MVVLLQHNILKRGVRVLNEFGWVRLFIILLGLIVGSMGVMNYISHHHYTSIVRQLSAGSVFIALNILSFVALAVAAPAEELRGLSDLVAQSISLPGSSDQTRRYDKWFCVWLAVGVFVVSAPLRGSRF